MLKCIFVSLCPWFCCSPVQPSNATWGNILRTCRHTHTHAHLPIRLWLKQTKQTNTHSLHHHPSAFCRNEVQSTRNADQHTHAHKLRLEGWSQPLIAEELQKCWLVCALTSYRHDVTSKMVALTAAEVFTLIHFELSKMYTEHVLKSNDILF